MLLPIPVVVNPQNLRAKRQALIDQNNSRENKRRRDHNCCVGDQITILAFKPNAMDDRAKGPHTVSQVHVNGTVSCMLNDHVIDQIDVQRVKPHCQAAAG